MYHKLALFFSTQLHLSAFMAEEEQDLAVYNIEIILINIGKLVVVYALAILLHTLLLTFATNVPFTLVRKYTRGWHAKSSLNCSLISCTLFVIFPKLLAHIYSVVPSTFAIIIGSTTLMSIFLFAPADTENNPFLGPTKRKYARYKALVITSIILAITYLVIPRPFEICVLFGCFLAAIMINPFFYKLLRRRYHNYENYENPTEN